MLYVALIAERSKTDTLHRRVTLDTQKCCSLRFEI
jgi:hypothetical protein